jgi:hypothetical protein
MEASYLEIYNEKLRDLLAPGATHADHSIQHKDGQTLVTGVQREEVRLPYTHTPSAAQQARDSTTNGDL